MEHDFIDKAIEKHYAERDGLGWYHGKGHVSSVIGLLSGWMSEDPLGFPEAIRDILLMAALYHDAVYVPGSPDNEEASAALAERELSGVLDGMQIRIVCELIRSTAFPDAIRDDGGCAGSSQCAVLRDMLHDADWHGFHNLGEMLDNEPRIMAEIRWALMNARETDIPLQSFMRRRQFLENLLELLEAGHPMFRTEHMKAYNKQAEENVRYLIGVYDMEIESQEPDGDLQNA